MRNDPSTEQPCEPKRKKFFNPFFFLSVLAAALLSYLFYSPLYEPRHTPAPLPESNRSHPVRTVGEANATQAVLRETDRSLLRRSHVKPHAVPSGTLPKLVIIIDDMKDRDALRTLDHLGLKLTYSFFPPSAGNVEGTPRMAASHPGSMIHLPMEALSYRDELPTLKVGDSPETIRETVRTLREEFPGVTLINNHTGSRFTTDLASMEILLAALREYGFTFLDSRTLGETATRDAARNIGDVRYYQRDVFLDHDDDLNAIKGQLAEAVRIAGEKGSCIAIGHPRPATIRALKESSALLKKVRLVHVDDLPAM